MTFSGFLQKRWLILAGEVLFFIILYLVLRAYMQRDMAHGPAPAIEAITVTQQPFRLAEARKPVLVHFWATWCGICKLEQDSIQAISRDHAVMTVAIQSGDEQAIKDYLAEHNLEFPVINDEAGEIAGRYGVVGVPASFIIAADGRIFAVERGYTTESGLRLRLWLAGF